MRKNLLVSNFWWRVCCRTLCRIFLYHFARKFERKLDIRQYLPPFRTNTLPSSVGSERLFGAKMPKFPPLSLCLIQSVMNKTITRLAQAPPLTGARTLYGPASSICRLHFFFFTCQFHLSAFNSLLILITECVCVDFNIY